MPRSVSHRMPARGRDYREHGPCCAVKFGRMIKGPAVEAEVFGGRRKTSPR